jgi:single-stranded DNA-specific DHH superfamily exonuclease
MNPIHHPPPPANDGAQAAPRRFDVCNGDADGLCAVLQWRLHEPAEATLVTGLKREIALLERVPRDAADEVLVCDLSMQRNHAALRQLLEAGVRVRYFDHHAAGEVPRHPQLEAHLDFGSEVCTSLLMDRHLGGRFRAWALVGAYGDDLVAVADGLAGRSGLDAVQRATLHWLGRAINYNAYGEEADDVRIAPQRLYRVMARWPDPIAMAAHEPIVEELDGLRQADLRQALAIAPRWQNDRARVVVLPDVPWSRRVSGSLANELAAAQPRQAQAVLRQRRGGEELSVSVRAPRAAPGGADRLCAAFGGSGRAAAAGIDALPQGDLDRFIEAFSTARWGFAH